MSYDGEHYGYWYSQNTAVTATVAAVTFNDGTNTLTAAGTSYRWNVHKILYEIVSSVDGNILVEESGASSNDFANIGGTGSTSTAGYREIPLDARGFPSANANRNVSLTVTGAINANVIIIATREKVA